MAMARVERATLLEDGRTPESDAAHTVALALLAGQAAGMLGLCPWRAAGMALVHDLPEAYAGDTPSYALSVEDREAKEAREAAAVGRILSEFEGTWLAAALMAYEAQEVPEARLARYLDKVDPKLSHAGNGCRALHAVGASDLPGVDAEHAAQGTRLRARYPELAGTVGALFDAACDASHAAWTEPAGPMEDAPREGECLVYAERAGCMGWVVAHWMPGGHCIEDHPPIDPGWYRWAGSDFSRLPAEPVAWAPLPPRPA